VNGGLVDRPRQPRPNRRTQRWLDTEEPEDRYRGRNDTVSKKNVRSRVTYASSFICKGVNLQQLFNRYGTHLNRMIRTCMPAV
jgi:hypothetical protein